MSDAQKNKKTKDISQKRITHLLQDTAPELDVNMVIRDNLGAQERRVRVPCAQIAKYYSGDQDISVIELMGGDKLYTTLPFDDLCARMDKAYLSRNKRIDLREYTGRKAHRAILERGLSKIFDMEAVDNRVKDNDFLIVMYGYGDRGTEVSSARRVVFLRSEITEITSNHDKGYQYLHLSDWSEYGEEWGMSNLSYGPYINIDKNTLTEQFKDAEKSGIKILDLSALSAPQDTSEVKMGLKVSKAAKSLRRP